MLSLGPAFRWIKRIAGRMKPRVYGRNKHVGKDAASQYAALEVSPAGEEPPKRNTRRPALSEISTNVAPPPDQKSVKAPKSASVAGKQSERSILLPESPPRVPIRVPERVQQTRNTPTVAPQPSEIAALTGLNIVREGLQEFQKFYEDRANLFNITKVGHGSYAGIFRIENRQTGDYVICKLMALRPRRGLGSRATNQTPIDEAAAEVQVLDRMERCKGFVSFRTAWVLRGPLPQHFKNEYVRWGRENDEEPQIEFHDRQLWLFMEMNDAGRDLGHLMQRGFPDGTFPHKNQRGQRFTIRQCWDIFWSTAEALRSGECNTRFEHRDLHPGNVCVRRVQRVTDDSETKEQAEEDSDVESSYERTSERESTLLDISPQHTSQLQTSPPPTSEQDTSLDLSTLKNALPKVGQRRPYTDLKATIIDYTLSRTELASGQVLGNPPHHTIFGQQAENPMDQHQYDTYGLMRDLVTAPVNGKRPTSVPAAWKQFVPQTNVLWLDHLLLYLLYHILFTRKLPRTRENPTGSMPARLEMTEEEKDTYDEDVMLQTAVDRMKKELAKTRERKYGCKWGSATELVGAYSEIVREGYEGMDRLRPE